MTELKRLIVSEIPSDFEPARDILLGPWCLLGKEEEISDWDALHIVPDPFSTFDELSRAATITSEYCNSLLPKITELLNSLNCTVYSVRFWRIIIMPWLLSAVQVIWERQSRILNFIQNNEDDIYVELLDDLPKWDFQNTLDFFKRGIFSKDYNNWLNSKILRENVPANWTVVNVKNMKEQQPFSSTPYLSNGFKTRIREKLIKPLATRCMGVTGIGVLETIFWSLLLSCKPKRRINDEPPKEEHVVGSLPEWKIDVEKILESSLPSCFKHIDLSKCPRSMHGKVRLTGPVYWYDEEEKVMLAHARESGERIIASQHGGNYGNAKSFPLVAETEYLQDVFLTWGWTGHEEYQGDFHPLSSPYLSKFLRKYKHETNNLILVGTRMHAYSYRLDAFPQPGEQILYRKGKEDFFRAMLPTVFLTSIYRPYPPTPEGLDDESHFRRLFPELGICRGELHPQILRCKLLVLDHPGTTLNIAMAANIPTICFWNSNVWRMCEQSQPSFDALSKAGILYETGKEAAAKVNEIWDDVLVWWNHHEVQRARIDWCHLYARASGVWWWEWAKFLWKL